MLFGEVLICRDSELCLHENVLKTMIVEPERRIKYYSRTVERLGCKISDMQIFMDFIHILRRIVIKWGDSVQN